MAMLAMKRFVTLLDWEDLFNTTNRPRVLPNRAIMKITAYAVVMPILIFSEIMKNSGGDGEVMLVARKEIKNYIALSAFQKFLSSV